MEYFNQVNKAINYIEKNLTRDIKIKEVAGKIDFSSYYFYRIFGRITGSTLKEYIRRRRLTRSAYDLIKTDKRIIEIAFKYQYNSQESYTRAFKKLFGTTPGEYRREKGQFILMQKKRLTKIRLRHLQGGIIMEPRIVEKNSFKVVGMKYIGENNNNEIPKMWDKFNKRYNEIKNKVGQVCYGVCEYVEDFSDGDDFHYMACAEVSSFEEIPEGMEGQEVPSNKYAVFTHKGVIDKLQETYKYIYSEWLPDSGYELIEAPDFEYYDERFEPGYKDSELDIYIPIK